MRYLPLCLIPLVLLALLVDEKADAKGVKVITKDGMISVVFPSAPRHQTRGKSIVHRLELKDGKSAYALTQSDLSTAVDLNDKALLKVIFEDGRAAALSGLKGKLLGKQDIELGKFPGHAFDAETATGICRARMYVTEKVLVQVIIHGPKEFVESAEARKLLDSIKVEP